MTSPIAGDTSLRDLGVCVVNEASAAAAMLAEHHQL